MTPLDDGVHWRLEKPLEYHMGVENSEWVISIPAGFVTDFASVPRILWPLISPWGNHGICAILHDYLYRYGVFDRVVCDALFLEAMRVSGVGAFKRRVIYASVRVWGRYAWRRHRKPRDPGDKRKKGS